jgi:predicted ATP-binding protein involved in virulence
MISCKYCGETDINKLCKDKRKKDGVIKCCYKCHNELWGKSWRNKNKERESNTRYLRTSLSRFGISLDEYNEMYERQNGVCVICGKNKNRRLCIDHDHTTGKIRGLLCRECNMALGYVQDETTVLKNMIEYLGG